MYVVELRGYFETPEGIDSIPPIGRISRHEDLAMLMAWTRRTRCSWTSSCSRVSRCRSAPTPSSRWRRTPTTRRKDTDTNGDGVADKKELFTTHFGRAGTMTPQQSSLFWALDNWLYSTVNAFRVRWTLRGVLREPNRPNGAQWGVTQDNYGKVWFQHGASGMPGYFQFPVHYGSFAWSDQFGPLSEHCLGRAHPDWRHPGRTAGNAHAGRIAHLRHRRRRQRHLPR